MIKEPILGKAEPNPLDYKELTFKDFIIIQNKAQEVANNIGYNVYLVGSALTKHTPRDIDIAIIIPNKEYVKKYTEGIYDLSVHKSACGILGNAFYAEYEKTEPLLRLGFNDYKIDLKICPDNWFTNQEKMILAIPNRGVKE